MMMAKILDVRASDDRAYKDYWWTIQRVNEGTRNAKVILFLFLYQAIKYSILF
jgi:hypothetical protein